AAAEDGALGHAARLARGPVGRPAPPVIRSRPTMARRSADIEVHKFGGASLADAAAFRRAIGIVRGRRARCVVVVSAPSGVTDALLEVTRRGVAGDVAGA